MRILADKAEEEAKQNFLETCLNRYTMNYSIQYSLEYDNLKVLY